MNGEQRSTKEYQDISFEQAFKLLLSSEQGLKQEDLAERRRQYGWNEIEEEKPNTLLVFLSRYWGPLPWLLELSMLLSFLVERPFEGLLIFALLTINASLSFFHIHHSQNVMALLKKRLATFSAVVRSGSWMRLPAKELLPGDVIAIKAGDIVPADVKFMSHFLLVDESVLTGESLPRECSKGDLLYNGSLVRQGEGRGMVVNIGSNTSFGKTALLTKQANPKSHQEKVMLDIIRYMMYVGLLASLLITLFAIFFHQPLFMIATFVITFLLGAVPVALPAILTIVQASAALMLAKKNILVTRLESIEDAASIDTLCFDKTGTITYNVLTVTDVLPMKGLSKEEVASLALLASQERDMDAVDSALIQYSNTLDLNIGSYRRLFFTPFDPHVKRTEALIEKEGGRYRLLKGALHLLLPLCQASSKEEKEEAETLLHEWAFQGKKTLALAMESENIPSSMKLIGLFALADPPRKSAPGMISAMKNLGIKPIMLTGDHLAIAKEIGRQVGIGEKILRMADLKSLSDAQKSQLVSQSDGVAEIYPEDKYTIVKLLQAHGHSVGMTGDGINDAPALKQAEMGIAVKNASDIAKASSSMVLLENGLHVLVDALKMSRDTYQRMLSWVINKETKVIQFLSILVIGFLTYHNMLLTLLGMVLLVLSNDFVTMALAQDNVEETSLPTTWDVKTITLASLGLGLFLTVETVLILVLGMTLFQLSFDQLRSYTLLTLIFMSQFRILIVRERRHFYDSFPSPWLLLAIGLTLLLFSLCGSYGVFMTPLLPVQVVSILTLSAVLTLLADFPKYALFKKLKLGRVVN